MRKTLTALVVLVAAGSLAACKMPWDKTEPPPAATVSTGPEATTPTTPTDPATPVNTAAADPAKPVTPEPTPAPATPARE